LNPTTNIRQDDKHRLVPLFLVRVAWAGAGERESRVSAAVDRHQLCVFLSPSSAQVLLPLYLELDVVVFDRSVVIAVVVVVERESPA